MKINLYQPNSTPGYKKYLRSESVESAAEFLRLNSSKIEQALSGRKIEPEVIVAILKVESNLGAYSGKYSIFNDVV